MLPYNHGGYCCGMTHIVSLYYSPDFTHGSLDFPENHEDQIAFYKAHPGVCITYDVPRQSGSERLKFLIEKITKQRPGGIIEITINTTQEPSWRKELEANGFKEVNMCRNSNSGRFIYVFHLNTGAK